MRFGKAQLPITALRLIAVGNRGPLVASRPGPSQAAQRDPRRRHSQRRGALPPEAQGIPAESPEGEGGRK